VLVARDAATFEALRGLTRGDGIVKRYLALVEGDVAADGSVDFPLVPHRKDPKRAEAVTEQTKLLYALQTKFGAKQQ